METTTFQIAWFDSKPSGKDTAGWKNMPRRYKTEKTAIRDMDAIIKVYPGIKFAVVKQTTEIVAQTA